MSAAALMFLAWLIEALFGWPDWLYRRIRHPVVWFGATERLIEKALNRMSWPHGVRYALGLLTTIILVAATTWLGSLIAATLVASWWGITIEAVIASSLIASRSLYTHVASVLLPLEAQDMDMARERVSMIVGRDPANLNEAGLARASLESLAENASDGVIAPLFWGALFGLPGIAAYKAINTLDSMIGHRNETYSAFGGFAARLDDVANLVPARMTGVLIAMAGFRPSAFEIMLRDASRHRSPNAGWAEAAMAGALGVRLSGPRTYGDQASDDPWLNAAAPDPTAGDIRRGLAIYIRALALCGALLCGFAYICSL